MFGSDVKNIGILKPAEILSVYSAQCGCLDHRHSHREEIVWMLGYEIKLLIVLI